jgi:DNA-directed RNA polymerase beta' subunit
MEMKLKFIDLSFKPDNIIDNPVFINKQMQFTNSGLFSPKYFGKMNSEEEDLFELNDNTDIESKGYIYLEKYKFLNPKIYSSLSNLIGDKNLKSYLIYISSEFDEISSVKTHPDFHHKGISTFIENFSEILEFHKNLELEKENCSQYKIKAYDFLLNTENQKNFCFTNRIEVFSNKLRPAILLRGDIVLSSINSVLNELIYTIGHLNDLSENETSNFIVEPLLWNIQESTNNYFSSVINIIFGKEGTIREKKLGKRLDFSIRAVITPSKDEDQLDRIDLPYVSVMLLLKIHYISYLSNIKKMSVNDAEIKFENSLEYSEDNYNLLLRVIKSITPFNTEYLEVIFSRNPVINIGSMNKMKAYVKKNNEKTISINNLIHYFLNSDHDGDVLNVFLIQTKEHSLLFDKICPHRFIQNFNSIENLIKKDYAVGLNSFFID